MGRPDPGHEARTRRGLRDMAGGTLDGLLEIPAPISPSAGPIRISRLGPDRVPPEPETCLRPYDDYDHSPHTSSPQMVPDGRMLATMVRSGEIRLGWWASPTRFLEGDDPPSVETFQSGLRDDGESISASEAPVATVSRAGGRTWLLTSWIADNVNADGDNRIVTRLWHSPDGNGDDWKIAQTLRDIVYDPAALLTEFRLRPNAGRVVEHDGRLVVMGAWWYLRSGDWVANHWGVWASDDNGDTWTLQQRFTNGPVGGPYTNSMGRNIVPFGSRLYAFTSDDYGGINNRLRYSDDVGATWSIAWNTWELPWNADQNFFGMTMLGVGSTMIGFFKQAGSPGDRVHIGKSTTPADLGSWEKIDQFDCEHHLDTLAYMLDGREWFEGNGALTEYLPT